MTLFAFACYPSGLPLHDKIIVYLWDILYNKNSTSITKEKDMSQVEEKYYTQDLGSLTVTEEDKKEIEKDWSAWILKQAERGLIEADGLFDEEGERI